MAKYDSDYEVRLATLAALGGDATKHYHSVYDIDIAILEVIEEGGGGEGMTWSQIKAKLDSEGVNTITFTKGAERAILDYDTLKNLIEGGGSSVEPIILENGMAVDAALRARIDEYRDNGNLSKIMIKHTHTDGTLNYLAVTEYHPQYLLTASCTYNVNLGFASVLVALNTSTAIVSVADFGAQIGNINTALETIIGG